MIVKDKGDIKEIQNFLHQNWQKNHIISKQKKVFNWLHYNKHEKKYNFFIFKYNKKIISFLGIIKNSKFSKKLKKRETIWLTNWVAKKKSILGVGLKLLDYAIKNLRYFKIGTVGCNDRLKKIYENFGFATGKLIQHYIINTKIKNYKIIKYKKNKLNINSNIKINKELSLSIVKKINFNSFQKNKINFINVFDKDENYFREKYIKNPFYKYMIYKFEKNNKLVGYYFTRECFYRNRKCLRIIEFFGNINYIFSSSFLFEKIIELNDYEFVDMYLYGINKNKSLFVKNELKKDIIIPNYFEPFVKKNITLNFAILKKKYKVLLI